MRVNILFKEEAQGFGGLRVEGEGYSKDLGQELPGLSKVKSFFLKLFNLILLPCMHLERGPGPCFTMDMTAT